jgi:hypothetical protein
MKLSKGKLYKVIWQDIHHDNTWSDKGVYNKLEDMQNVWYYLDHNKDYYIFSSGGDSKQNFDTVYIPKGCIKSVSNIIL